MKILVSDMGGVLYSFDRNFDSDIHLENFKAAVKKFGRPNPTPKEEMEAEWQAISSGFLKFYPHKEGITNTLINLERGYRLVVVATSLVKTTETILAKIGLSGKAWKIFDISDYGSKKDSEAWKKIFQTLPGVDVIAEDGEKNLTAATQAAADLGFKPQTFIKMPLLG